jgi:hypothetical protein
VVVVIKKNLISRKEMKMNNLRSLLFTCLVCIPVFLLGCGDSDGKDSKPDKDVNKIVDKAAGKESGKTVDKSEGKATNTDGEADGKNVNAESSVQKQTDAKVASTAPAANSALMYLPDNAFVIASFTPADVLSSNMFKLLVKEIPDIQKGLDEFKKESGFLLSDIARVTIGLNQLEAPGAVLIVDMVEPISLALLKANIKQLKNLAFKEEKVGNFNYATATGPFGELIGFGLVTEKRFVTGPSAETVRAVLSRGGEAKLAGGMTEMINTADFTSNGVFLADASGINPQAKASIGNKLGPLALFVNAIQAMDIQVQIADNASLNLAAKCVDANTAITLTGMLDALLKQASADNPEAKMLADNVKMSNDGTVAKFSLAIKADDIIAGMKRAQTAAKRVQRLNKGRQLAIGCFSYASDHRNQFPASLGEMISGGYGELELVLIDTNKKQMPELGEGEKGVQSESEKAKIADWVNKNSDFVYISGQKDAFNAGAILLFERPTGDKNNAIAVVFGDGHVESKDASQLDALLVKQTSKGLTTWSQFAKPGAGTN